MNIDFTKKRTPSSAELLALMTLVTNNMSGEAMKAADGPVNFDVRLEETTGDEPVAIQVTGRMSIDGVHVRFIIRIDQEMTS